MNRLSTDNQLKFLQQFNSLPEELQLYSYDKFLSIPQNLQQSAITQFLTLDRNILADTLENERRREMKEKTEENFVIHSSEISVADQLALQDQQRALQEIINQQRTINREQIIG